MRRENYIFNGEHLERVTRAAAKKIYESGRRVFAVPVNINLSSPWAGVFEITREEGRTFERTENAIIYYNCNSETGLYLKYFQALPPMEDIQGALYDSLLK